MSQQLREDAQLTNTRALPSGASTVNSAGIDLDVTVNSNFAANCEMEVVAPAVNATELPDTQTLTYVLQHDTDPAFGSATSLTASLIVQTGAGGAGAVSQTVRFQLPSNVKRYVRLRVTKSGTGDASGKTATMKLLF